MSRSPHSLRGSDVSHVVSDQDHGDVLTGHRPDEKFYVQVKRLTESHAFNGCIIFIIFVNSLIMALETEESMDYLSDVFSVLDYTFLSIYTLEFILKVYAEPKNYWKSSYNLFDFVVLTISYAQIVAVAVVGSDKVQNLQSLRVLRALRTLRTLRTVSFIKGLQILVIALIDTIRRWVINIIILLFLLMFLFANMGYYFFGERDDGDKVHWGSLTSALLTLFSFVTVDGWTDLQKHLDKINMTLGRIFTIVFIFLGHFIFTNVFIGVIIMNISEATENYKQLQIAEREAIIKYKKEYMMMRQNKDVKQLLERQKKGNFSDFHEMVEDFEKTLRHEDSMMMSDLCTNIIWMETFIHTLDHMDTTMYRIQQFHFEMVNLLAQVMEEKLRESSKKKLTTL